MVDLEYAKYLAEILLSEEEKEEVKDWRFEAMIRLRNYAGYFESKGFISELIEKMFCKKAEFIMEASTKHEINEILKQSTPHYDGNKFVPTGRFYVEEEELMLWSLTSLNGPLISAGYDRYVEVFEAYLGKKVEDMAA